MGNIIWPFVIFFFLIDIFFKKIPVSQTIGRETKVGLLSQTFGPSHGSGL